VVIGTILVAFGKRTEVKDSHDRYVKGGRSRRGRVSPVTFRKRTSAAGNSCTQAALAGAKCSYMTEVLSGQDGSAGETWRGTGHAARRTLVGPALDYDFSSRRRFQDDLLAELILLRRRKWAGAA